MNTAYVPLPFCSYFSHLGTATIRFIVLQAICCSPRDELRDANDRAEHDSGQITACKCIQKQAHREILIIFS